MGEIQSQQDGFSDEWTRVGTGIFKHVETCPAGGKHEIRKYLPSMETQDILDQDRCIRIIETNTQENICKSSVAFNTPDGITYKTVEIYQGFPRTVWVGYSHIDLDPNAFPSINSAHIFLQYTDGNLEKIQFRPPLIEDYGQERLEDIITQTIVLADSIPKQEEEATLRYFYELQKLECERLITDAQLTRDGPKFNLAIDLTKKVFRRLSVLIEDLALRKDFFVLFDETNLEDYFLILFLMGDKDIRKKLNEQDWEYDVVEGLDFLDNLPQEIVESHEDAEQLDIFIEAGLRNFLNSLNIHIQTTIDTHIQFEILPYEFKWYAIENREIAHSGIIEEIAHGTCGYNQWFKPAGIDKSIRLVDNGNFIEVHCLLEDYQYCIFSISKRINRKKMQILCFSESPEMAQYEEDIKVSSMLVNDLKE